MVCLSSGLENESESDDEITYARDAVLDELKRFIWGEASVAMGNPKIEDEASRLDANLRYLAKEAKRVGYEQAESLYARQVRDLEELLEKERKEWKRLKEKERTGMGEEMRGMVRKEMERVLEEWGEKRGVKNRDEMRREMDKALRKRDDRVREEMGEWIKVVEEGGARDIHYYAHCMPFSINVDIMDGSSVSLQIFWSMNVLNIMWRVKIAFL